MAVAVGEAEAVAVAEAVAEAVAVALAVAEWRCETFFRKLLKIFKIKKTRSAILCKKMCLTAPHHFSQPYW